MQARAAIRLLRTGAAALLIGGASIAAAQAQGTGTPYYQDKKVTMLIGSSPGGGYDVYARLISTAHFL